jgi:hypothetical protein
MGEPGSRGLGPVGVALLALSLGAACRQEVAGPTYGLRIHLKERTHGHHEGSHTESWIDDAPGIGDLALGPALIAEESLRWFEEHRDPQMPDDVVLRLELVYPSEGLEIVVRHAPGVGTTWEDQLRAWFERFPPPAQDTPPWAEGGYVWSVTYGERGEVHGRAQTAKAATEEMLALADRHEPGPQFPEPGFGLGFAVGSRSDGLDSHDLEGVLRNAVEERLNR